MKSGCFAKSFKDYFVAFLAAGFPDFLRGRNLPYEPTAILPFFER